MKRIGSIFLMISMVILLSACGLFSDIHTFELFDYENPDTTLADVHGDHWDGALPTLRLNETFTLGLNVKLSRNEVIDFYSDAHDYRVEAKIKEGSRTDLVEIENHSNRISIIPLNEGITELVFTLYDGDEVIYESPGLYLMVYGESDEVGRVLDTFELYDINRDLQLGYVHVDHWHGGVGQITLNESLLLTAIIEDDKEVIDLTDDHVRLEARVVTGANTSIVNISNQNNEILIEAETVGNTQIVFLLFVDDELYYQSPPTSIRVVE